MIQQAYRGIMAFMSGLKQSMEKHFPEHASSALYAGYMDMTYFASTPPELKRRNLKIAVVYLHEANAFEAWLAGGNRRVQEEYVRKMGRLDTRGCRLSSIGPGVDSILERRLLERPDFDKTEELTLAMERKTMAFARDILAILAEDD